MLLVKRAIQSSRPDVRAEPQSQRPQVCSAVAAHAAERRRGDAQRWHIRPTVRAEPQSQRQMAERQTTVANPNLDPFPTGWGSALVGSRACFRGSVLFCTRFVYRISCRDPRPYPSLNPNPNLNLNPDPLPQAGERCAVCGRTLGLCAPFCFILHPLRLPHQLPRSATATPAAVTPQHQTPDRTLLQNTIMRTFCFL